MANLRTKAAKWYEVTAAVNRVQDDGTEKVMKEVYVVDTQSCSQAESRVLEELASFGTEQEIVKVQKLPVAEFIFDEDNINAETWHKVKVIFVTIDENSGKEKKSSQYFMVLALDIKTAESHIRQVFDSSMSDYRIAGITETPVLEVYEEVLV